MTETTGSTATPESGDTDGVDAEGVEGAVSAEDGAGETLSRRDRKRAAKSGTDGDAGKPVKGEKKKARRAKQGPFSRIALFYRQIIAELRKVVWPTRSELLNYTSVVIVFVIVIMAVVSGLDWGFSKLSLKIFG